MTGLAVVVGLLVLATAVGLWWHGRNGRVRAVGPAVDGRGGAGREGSGKPGSARAPREDPEQSPDAEAARALAALGVRPGTPVTLVQFSSAVCAPCRVARRVCAEIASSRDGVTHLEIDAESRLEPVRSLGIWRTPTVLVVDAAGRIRYRVTGAPRKAQLDDAVAATLPAAVAP